MVRMVVVLKLTCTLKIENEQYSETNSLILCAGCNSLRRLCRFGQP